MRETRWNGLSVVLVCVLFIMDVHMSCVWKEVDCVIESRWLNSREESGKERVGKREKKGKVIWGKKSVFLLLCDHVFHSILYPPFNPPCHHSSSYTHTHTAHSPHHNHACVLSSFFLCVWLSVHSFHTQSNNTTPCNHATATHDTTNGWCNEWMGKSSGDWGHHTTNTKHHNEVMMAITSLGLIGCMDWACTLITTPQRQWWG